MDQMFAYPSSPAPSGPVPTDASSPEGQWIASKLMRLADRPFITGVAGFVTTALVLLPVEYQMPLRGLMFFLSTRRL